MDFRWNEWNLTHIREHGIEPYEAEQVILAARSPYPRRCEQDKYLVWGPGLGGRLVQVVFALDADQRVFAIHARLLTQGEKRAFRRRRR